VAATPTALAPPRCVSCGPRHGCRRSPPSACTSNPSRPPPLNSTPAAAPCSAATWDFSPFESNSASHQRKGEGGRRRKGAQGELATSTPECRLEDLRSSHLPVHRHHGDMPLSRGEEEGKNAGPLPRMTRRPFPPTPWSWNPLVNLNPPSRSSVTSQISQDVYVCKNVNFKTILFEFECILKL
jgi:hypothetical protein